VTSILSIEHLSTSFATDEGRIQAVSDVSFEVHKGRTLGIVGESGCGKSVTALSVMRLLPKPSGVIETGRIQFDGMDLASLPPDQMQGIRGKRIAMIFQEPMTALNPVHRIGKQLEEVFQIHFPEMEKKQRTDEALVLLKRVGIPDPEGCLKSYPHRISGGMRQRVMIAMALGGKPEILIADEPTTALDVTIQAQILDLIKSLQEETGMAVMFITHDLGVIAEICDEVVVMYAGKIAEKAGVKDLFYSPAHPYTQGLLSSIPRLDSKRKSPLSIIRGMVPGLGDLPEGCRFENRCPMAMDICKSEPPAMIQIGDSHWVSCYLFEKGQGNV
jgi:oligopeptide/dipeptide ABC transporter ATP-binding protein